MKNIKLFLIIIKTYLCMFLQILLIITKFIHLYVMVLALRPVMFEVEVCKCKVDLKPLVHLYVQGEVMVSKMK